VNIKQIALVAGSMAILSAQSGSTMMVTNLSSATWTHEKEGSTPIESVLLHEDAKTGGMELLVRFPGGHVIAPHFHDSNERIIVLEGQLTLRKETSDATVDAGGYAFLPSGEVQRLSCSAKTRCTFYLSWDGKPKSHPVK
jgi:quercetin dioxygenase-like cupin family protein